MLTTVRVQEKGQVTIPGYIRKKLRLKRGDLVTFVVKENGVVIQPVHLRQLAARQTAAHYCHDRGSHSGRQGNVPGGGDG